MPEMQEVFEKLQSLQEILSRKFAIEAEIRDIPKTLSTKQELVNRLKKSYIDKNAQYDEVKERIRNLRTRLDEAEQTREKFEQQMDLIKTQREYEALDKEIRDASEKEQNLRKDLQREERIQEEMEHALQREEAMITEQEKELDDEQTRIKKESEVRKASLKDLEKEEKKVSPGLDEEILFKFERIIRSKAGVGIVPLKKGVCSGCHMVLPMQFVNEVRAGDGVLFCPYCSRILFFEEETDAVYSEEEAEGLADLFTDEESEEEYDEAEYEEGDDDEADEEEDEVDHEEESGSEEEEDE